jgi:hypothetical protein
MIKWMELLDMDIEVIFKDSEESDLPSGKIFKYSSTDGYNVQWQEGFEEYEEDEMEGDEEDED